ncbi:MAG: LuxR C-terminal-related transcriptional regulator, partial [Thermomicrobiales bacterium]
LGASFPDGIVFVSLVATNDPERVPSIVAQALALDPRADRTAADAVRDAIGNRGMLLLLDNLEHVLPSAMFLAELLGACPRLSILATSRTRLDLTGEHVYVLDPLAADDARTLFLQRAGAYNAGHPQADDRPTIDAICGRLDRIPLAIELAAARTATFSPVALLDRLGDPLTVLRHGPRAVPLRHQTMRDTIAWSYALLDEEQKAGFRRLAVFVGGFTLEGAQAVLGDGMDALDLVEFLAARSLVVPMRGESTQLRFTMLESIRQFGVDALAATGEDEMVRAVHADWLIAMAEHAIPFYDGPQLMAYARAVRNEMDNIRAALDWSFQRRDGVRANRLAGAIAFHWESGEASWLSTSDWRDHVYEGLSWTERALALREGVSPHHLFGAMAAKLSMASLVGYSDALDELAKELLAYSLEAHDCRAELSARCAMANLARDRGELDAARMQLDLALTAAARFKDPDTQLSVVYSGKALLELGCGDMESAERHGRKAIEHALIGGNPFVLMGATAYLMLAVYHQRKWAEAAHLACENLQYLATLNDIARTYLPAELLADLALLAGQPHEAVRLTAFADAVPHYYGVELYPVEDIQARVRGALPDAELLREWDRGVALDVDEVINIGRRVVAILESMHANVRPASLLSPREDEVLRLLVAGKTNRAIGNELFISERTVERHVFHLMTKLDRDSRTALVAWAVRNGFDG